MTRIQVQGLTSAIRTEIERMIARGELQMGDRINEVALANTFGVSRGPIREACRGLAERGFLTVIPNRGAFVREISVEQACKLYEARAGVFGYAGYLLASRPDPALLQRLNSLLERMEAVVESGDVGDYYPLNLEFHRSIIEATGNPELIRIYQTLVDQLHLFRATGLVQPGSLRQSNREHRDIVEGIASGQPRVAFEALHAHVAGGMRRMLAHPARSRHEPDEEDRHGLERAPSKAR
jgi:DNA-binding GntR family transcriptional regulator